MPRRKRPKRRGYVRPSRAKAKAGWTLHDLAAFSGTTVRTIRLYLQRGVLPRPRFMASATRYQRRHLVCLLAIRRLRATENLTLAAIRTRLLLKGHIRNVNAVSCDVERSMPSLGVAK
jgi:hypothetical protein